MAGTLKFHSTCSFRLGLPAKLRPSETVGTCFLVMYGKEPHALIAGLSTPPQPFWLKVHTALVHSCNSVICPWLDGSQDVQNADRPPQEAACWDCAGLVAEPGPRECVVQVCTTRDSQREAARGKNAGSFPQSHGSRRMPCRNSSWTMRDANTMACPRR